MGIKTFILRFLVQAFFACFFLIFPHLSFSEKDNFTIESRYDDMGRLHAVYEQTFQKCINAGEARIENLNKLALAVETAQENCPHVKKAQEQYRGLGSDHSIITPPVHKRVDYIKEKESSLIKDLTVLKGRRRFFTSFVPELNTIQTCGESLKSLSLKTAVLRESISSGVLSCGDINSQTQLKKCIEVKKGLLEKTKILAGEAEDLRFRCDSVLTDFSAVSKLSNSIKDMELDLVSLNSDYDWVASRRQVNETVYENQRYMGCSFSILPHLSHLHNREFKVNMADYYKDIYAFKKNFLAVRILNDYIAVQARMCTAEAREPQNKWEEGDLGRIKSTVQKSQNILEKLNTRYADVVLEQWPALRCEQFKKEYNMDLALCENPVNTPSWAYAVHQEVENKVKVRAEKESE